MDVKKDGSLYYVPDEHKSRKDKGSKSTTLKIIHFSLQGWSQEQIAKELGCARATVNRIMGSPFYKQQHEISEERVLATMQDKLTSLTVHSKVYGDNVEKVLKDGAISAAEKMVELSHEGDTGAVQLSASKEVLDRAGYARKAGEVGAVMEVEEKLLERIERVMGDDGKTTAIRERQITTKKQVSE